MLNHIVRRKEHELYFCNASYVKVSVQKKCDLTD